jgi:glycosyltransferase involved in cell wall biosynthesis
MTTTATKLYPADFPGSVGVVLSMLGDLWRHRGRMWGLYRRRRRAPEPSGKVRVAFVGDNMDSTHGISVSATRMVGLLREEGHEAWLLGVSHSASPPGPRDPDGWIRMFQASSAQAMFGYEGRELSFPHLPDLIDFLEAHPVDLVEIETPGFVGMLFVLLARLMGVPIVHNYRTDLLAYTRMLLDNRAFIDFLRWFICGFLRVGDADVIVPSEAFVEQVQAMGLPRRRVHFLRRSVDLSRFSPDRGDAGYWATRGAPEGPVISFLGRVSREKGLETLAEAFEVVLRSRPDAVLAVIGDGPWREEFEKRMAPTARAVFTGELAGDELPRALASSAVFAFPSTTDTFGNAVLEALACGVPAVVTDQGGPREIVEDGRSGLVVPGGEADPLARSIVSILDDARLRSRLAEGALRRAALYRPEASRDEHLAFYRSALGIGGRSVPGA